MKRKSLLFAILIALAALSSRGQSFESGDIQIKAGLGGPNWQQLGLNLLPDGNVKRNGLLIMPSAKVEYFANEKLSIGLSFNYRKSRSDIYQDTFTYSDTLYSGRFGMDLTRYVLGLHAEYHPGWFVGNKWVPDIYFGGLAGVRMNHGSVILDSDVQEIQAIYEYLSSIGFNKKKLEGNTVMPRVGAYIGLQMPVAGPLGFYIESGLGVPLLQFGLKAHF